MVVNVWVISSINISDDLTYIFAVQTLNKPSIDPSADTNLYAIKDGQLQKSTDDGYTWQSVQIQNQNYFHAIHFVNSNTGFVVGDGGVIYMTADGGEPGYKLIVACQMIPNLIYIIYILLMMIQVILLALMVLY